ncbi:hypothetical protein [Streptomyces sp. NPDC018833]|uniref:hypothetical protein n=1 Tax=Streptomyces sp. NPDC018833 TaxID=3365053 RepID=UPI0037B5604B
MNANVNSSAALTEALPPIGTLTQRQQRGIDCVFCGIVLSAGTVIDLGPRPLRKGDWNTQWFPRVCRRHPELTG